jgi:ABC-type transport system involved in multi-copper enzyme maturation permease subunit
VSTATAANPDVRDRPGTDHRATFWRVVRSEWTKIWSVRSTFWALLMLVVVTIGFAALFSWGTQANLDQLTPEDRATLDPTNISLAGMLFGQLIAAVLGALVISSEYSTGGIRSTLAAVPNRLKLLAAKAVVLVVIVVLIGTITSFAAFYMGQMFFARSNLEAELGDPNVLRALLGAGLYLGGCAMLGFAVGALLRSTPAAITTAVAALFVLPLLSNALPGEWGNTIMKYFTQNAGSQVATTRSLPDMLGPWTGFTVFTVEWLVVMVVAAVLMVRRDA